jgi:hypothetical protein
MTDLQVRATNSEPAPGYLGVEYNQYFDNAFTKAFGLNSRSTLEKLAEDLKQQNQTYRLLPNPDMDLIKIVEKLRFGSLPGRSSCLDHWLRTHTCLPW